MKNETKAIPFDQLKMPDVKTATFKSENGEHFFTYAPGMDYLEFMTKFPNHKPVYTMLESSGSSWLEHAFIFYVEDCFDPPVYLQFGSSFEDAYESYCDNDDSLLIDEADMKDYTDQDTEYHGSYTSDGKPIDTEAVKGFQVRLSAVTF